VLDDAQADCSVVGYVLLPSAIECMVRGDYPTALETFARADQIGARFGDVDLITLARQGRGRALIRLGKIAEGVALLDEVLVALTAHEASPIVFGTVYCSVIEACHEMFDMRRAKEWTFALGEWCAAHPELVPFRGACLLRRAEIMQLQGAWPAAMDDAQRAQEWLLRPPPQRAVGAAIYRQAELHRLRGEFAEAEEAYRRASEWGRSPYPGLAELRLSQGQPNAAAAALRRVLEEARETRTRAPVLAAYAEIALATGDVAAAQAAGSELAEIAEVLGAPMLRAAAHRVEGAVLLAMEDGRAALAALRDAWIACRELDAPYEAARVQALLGLACRAVGDEEGAALEWAAARRTFEQLGARPDLARLDELAKPAPPNSAGRLTAREMEVLRLVATGKTNRRIADQLAISEKTVARHVSNIFTKLDLSTRAAATAYAYQHDLM
jgi:DNA-binding CsgD family transcriptional regulator